MMKKTREIDIGGVKIGGDNPIAIQGMCTTKTHDVEATVGQILALEREGCDIVRVAVPDKRAVDAIPKIKERIHIPLVADIHFSHRLAIMAIEKGADKIRINPGNIGGEEKVSELLAMARVPISIGINAGSMESDILEKYGHPTAEAMVESALRWVEFFEKHHFYQIVLSLKSADVRTSIAAHEMISERTDYPLHIGVTESGTFLTGTIKSSICVASLLQKKIGNTFRISMTEDPITQIKVAKEILRTLGLRLNGVEVISCPICGRRRDYGGNAYWNRA